MQDILLALAVLAPLALAQEVTASTPPPTEGTIIVQARNGALLESYVDRVARPEPGRQLARWNAPLCIRYEGLADRFATFIQARIVEAAADVGVRVPAKTCPTDVLIKLTDQADQLTRDLLRVAHPPIGNMNVLSLRPLSRRAIAAFEAPRTVRWMTASVTVNNDGMPISDTNPIWSSSLIRSTTREAVQSKIILIDQARLANVTLNQLADYIAFVTLATPDIASDFSNTDSIMALFADGSGVAPARMTQQDRTFLQALYLTLPDRPAVTQENSIHARMRDRASHSSSPEQ